MTNPSWTKIADGTYILGIYRIVKTAQPWGVQWELYAADAFVCYAPTLHGVKSAAERHAAR